MDRKLNPGTLQGVVPAVSSKSHVHRLLICAALSGDTCLVRHTAPCQDITATVRCLQALGAQCRTVEGGTEVTGIGGIFPLSPRTLACGESGSTLRFLLPMLAMCGGGVCQGQGRLMQRPVTPLSSCLAPHGISLQTKDDIMTVSCQGEGLKNGGVFRIASDVSSQFISGLLLTLPLAKGDSRIVMEGARVSAPYIALTRAVQSMFGIKSEETADGFLVFGGQQYRLNPCYGDAVTAEGDWSGAAFFLAAGAVGKKPVSVSGLSDATAQGDAAIMSILQRFGALCEMHQGIATVTPAPLRGITVDAAPIPDLVPILSVVASEAEEDSHFLHIERLRGKESDRVQGIINLLHAFGKRAYVDGDALTVCGTHSQTTTKSCIEVDPMGDHRLAMSAAVAALTAPSCTLIRNSDCVKKSYPDFFERFNQSIISIYSLQKGADVMSDNDHGTKS